MSGPREVGVRIKVGADGTDKVEDLADAVKELGGEAQKLDGQVGGLGRKIADTGQASATAARDAAQLATAAGDAAGAAAELAGATGRAAGGTADLGRGAGGAAGGVTALGAAGAAAARDARQLAGGADAAEDAASELAGSASRAAAQAQELGSSGAAAGRQLDGLQREAEEASRAIAQTGSASARAATEQVQAGNEVAGSLEGVQERLTSIGKLALGGVLGAGSINFLKSVTETADAFNSLRARMQLVTGEGPALSEALEGVERIALSTGASLENTGTLFSRILSAGQELGLAQEDALRLTESINQAVAVSGASAAASDAAITQLIQGLQSGVLRGEEFNSVVEQTPRLAQALADGLGVTRGELRGLAQDGQLSAEAVIKALQSQSAALEEEFGQLPETVGRAVQNLNTAWQVFIGNLDQSTGFTEAVASGINGIAQRLDDLAGIATRAGAVLVAALAVQAAGALRQLGAQALATAGQFGVLAKSINEVPKVVNIAIAVTGFEIGFQLGNLLRENSELARKLGVGITEFFVSIIRDLTFVKEAATAIFTDDTVAAAFERLKTRAREQQQIFAEMYAEAEQSPAAVRAAAEAASSALQGTGRAAQGAGQAIATAAADGAAGVRSVQSAADTAAGAIAALVQTAKQQLPQAGKAAADQARELAKLAEAGGDVAKALAERIPAAIEKLNGSELSEFTASLTGALITSRNGAALLDTALEAVGKRAAQALGVDVVAASSKASKEFAAQVENLELLINTFPALERAGVDTSKVVRDALATMIDSARNKTELDELKTRIQALGRAGEISKPQVEGLMKALEDGAKRARGELEKAVEAVDKTAEAYKTLGLSTSAELKAIAERNRDAWRLIQRDATASLDTKQQAFKRYAESALAANGGVVTSTLRAQAAGVEMGFEYDKAGRVIVRSLKEAAAAAGGLEKETRDAGKAAEEAARGFGLLSDAAIKARNARVSANAIQNTFGELIRNTPSGGITRTVDTGQATNRPAGNGWYYTLNPYEIAVRGLDRRGNPVPGGWARDFNVPLGLDDPRALGAGVTGGGIFNGNAGWTPFGTAAGAASPMPPAGSVPSQVVEIRFPRQGGGFIPATVANQALAQELVRILEDEARRLALPLP